MANSDATNHHPLRIEFAVNVSDQSDLSKVEQVINGQGVRLLSSDAQAKTVLLEIDSNERGLRHSKHHPDEHVGGKATASELISVQSLQRLIEKETGFVAVLKGLGESSSAVAELRPSEVSVRDAINIMGVVRLSQLDDNSCYIDATFDGVNLIRPTKRPYKLSLAIHQFGALDDEQLNSIGDPIARIHDLPLAERSASGPINVSKVIHGCQVPALIGRSVALTGQLDEPDKRHFSAGVIARASTIGRNRKQICTCSGKTLWQERLDRRES